MAIVVRLDELLARRKKKSKELAEYVGITEQNISLIRTGRVKGIRFSTLEKMCEFLECQPGDLLEFEPSSMD
ncbi:MAG: helix-turn-helix transcriptional regulator [Gammaproteobacteria bacterium]